jgi:hypothetical protein
MPTRPGRAHSRAMSHAGPTEAEEETPVIQLVPTETMEELDYRENDGIAVSLLWHRASNRLSVRVEDGSLGESFTLPARPDNARDVFIHPYAYAQPLLAA